MLITKTLHFVLVQNYSALTIQIRVLVFVSFIEKNQYMKNTIWVLLMAISSMAACKKDEPSPDRVYPFHL